MVSRCKVCGNVLEPLEMDTLVCIDCELKKEKGELK
jgi:uncharacterized OB-fold protein